MEERKKKNTKPGFFNHRVEIIFVPIKCGILSSQRAAIITLHLMSVPFGVEDRFIIFERLEL